MLKKRCIFLIISLIILSISVTFADITDNNDQEIEESIKIQQYQELVKNELFTEVEKNFGTVLDFYNHGAIYWEDDTLVLGIKKSSTSLNSAENTEIFSELSKRFNNDNSNIKVIELDYTSNELKDLVDKIWDLYLDYGDASDIIGVGTLDNIGKVEITINKYNQRAKQSIAETYGDSVIFIVDQNSSKPEPDISRERDWTVLGGGIAGSRQSGGNYCTMGGIGVKDGVHYLITAGHCLRTLGSNYYQYYSKVGVQHTNAMSYPVPYDLELIRITDSSLRSSGGTIVKRRASNKLYLNDENNNNYTGSIIGTRYPLIGDIVSKSGVETGITSGRVNSLNHKVEYTGYRPIYCVRVERHGSTVVYSDGGDSGAPTYVNGVDLNTKHLVGIHSGKRGSDIGYFTPYYRLYDAFGSNFRVYTSGLEVILD